MSSYTLSATVALPYEDAVAATRAALADQGFGVLTEIDIAVTLKAKLDVDMPRQVILGACRPPLAYAALQADPSVAAMLPCNVVVRSLDDGTCLVEAIDPAAMTQLVPGLEHVAAEAGSRLTAALAALTEEH
ncbi:DUF302 domain-containing protein [Nocardioides sp. MAH-18]|uniref:DUF302 domain-containing protein n=1 Tax=Nocardioides agri TaxID=2682843 RepID=A0A6L6XVF2_9ACTN|nr:MULTISPECIES: DUF302 domain-containing protein [unclassified Nocardioides]MBA2956316.1 DUF302 domain-containing protein [Nocardioides sp. CGMCC 1.13656]MVQ51159.1 DUF302 domain-containing protein [Nocardioides sp. MAH-18]